MKIKKTTPLKALAKITSNDELREVLSGILYDIDRKCMVATDAHILTVYPVDFPPSLKQSILINPVTGMVIDGSYPNYTSIIPDNEIKVELSEKRLERLHIICNSFAKSDFILKLVFDKYEGFFKPALLLKAINVMLELGYNDICIHLPDSPTRAILLKSELDTDILTLLMPCMEESDPENIEIFNLS